LAHRFDLVLEPTRRASCAQLAIKIYYYYGNCIGVLCLYVADIAGKAAITNVLAQLANANDVVSVNYLESGEVA
jgi:hypothetical protein